MRWTWIDRLIEFQSGQQAKAVKNFAITEDFGQFHFPSYPIMPASLVLEGMAQTAGLLVLEHFRFTRGVVLAKVSKVVFRLLARPGDRLVYAATIRAIREEGVAVSTTSHLGDRLHASAELMLAALDPSRGKAPGFNREEVMHVARLVGMFQVAANPHVPPVARTQ